MIEKNSRFLSFIFIILIYILIFQNLIQQYIPFFSYIDEIVALSVIPVFLIKILNEKKLKIKLYDFVIVICLILIFVIGMLSNIQFKYQSFFMALSDALLIFKFFFVYFLFLILNKNRIFQKNDKIIVKNLKFITLVLFLYTILNYVLNLYPYEYRYGIMSNKLFYTHPTSLASVCMFIILSMILFNKKIKDKYIGILIFIIITTLRIKAIGGVITFLIIAMYVNKKNKKITLSKLIILAGLIVLVAFEQIDYYFIENGNSARAVLLKTSFEIANDNFPLGSGFATFASYFSAKEYSPIYSLYKINNVYGLTKENANFISDSFWPMILGQFGYLGLIAYVIIIFVIFKKIQITYSKENKYMYIAKMSALSYLLISSTSEAAFAHPMAIPFAILLAL